MANYADNILTGMNQVPTFKPTTASVFADWSVQPGDIVTIEKESSTARSVETIPVPVFSSDLTWNGAATATIQSTGSKKRQKMTKKERQDVSTRKMVSRYGGSASHHSHQVYVNPNTGYATLGEVISGDVGGNFNFADTKFYKDGMSATKREYNPDDVTVTSITYRTGDSVDIRVQPYNADNDTIGTPLLAENTTVPASVIKATKTYRDGVSDATTSGYASGRRDYEPDHYANAYVSNYSTTNKTVTVKFDMENAASDKLATWTLSGLNATNFFNAAKSTMSADEIQLSGFTWYSSTSGYSTSQKTSLKTLSDRIRQNKNGQGYIEIKAKINGGTGTKTYYITIG